MKEYQNRIKNVKDIGTIIKNKRNSINLSQQELSEMCGVGRRFISELESGKKNSFEIALVLRVLTRLNFSVHIFDKSTEEV